jgi:hypothetical protein
MMTDEQDRLMRKAIRARSLVDPLGAMGYRTTSTRVDREARWRRAAFAATGACFASILGSILVGTDAGNLVGGQLPIAQETSEVIAPARQLSSTSGQPISWDDYDDDDDHDNDDHSVGSFQILPASSQTGAVSAQTTHGRTGGS